MPTLLSAVSHFSLRRGVHSPGMLCKYAKEAGYDAIALTDRNNLYGLPEFLRACEYYELLPVIAAEIVSADTRLLVYAHGDAGYANLCRILSDVHCNEAFDAAASLVQAPEGLRVATEDIRLLQTLSGHVLSYYRITSTKRPPAYVRDNDVPCLVVPRVAFLTEGAFEIHRLLRAIDLNTTLSRLSDNDGFSVKDTLCSWSEICERFGVFEKALNTTEQFIRELRSRTDFGVTTFPRFPSKEPALRMLRRKAFAGATRRYPVVTGAVTDRLNYELDLIGRKGFASYFLVVDDIVRQSPRTCGRGSGAASIVSYCLGITNVDPIRYNLMFERFLNPGRKDPPDIDVDFAWDERDSVLDYVFEKYGHEHAAMVAVHLTFGARMALRETARVYGLTEAEISAVTKKFPYVEVPSESNANIEELIRLHPKLRHLNLDPPWPEIVAKARKLFGIPYGIGTHCGGVVITPGPIRHAVPVQISAKGYPVIHWEKDGAEEMGLVKIDLLGNRSLAVIRDAIGNLVCEGIRIDECRWDPANDPETVALLASGKTMGVFYVESPAMRLLQEKSRCGDFEHMVIHSSIIRPAANRWINEYLRRLHGGAYEYEHPLLKGILEENYGIMVYQEDVAKVAVALAGFSYEDADMLRKIMAKKDRRGKLKDYRERFFRGAAKNGVSQEKTERIWDMCMSFSGYSFCKPHSASYVQVSFQSAWLKAHYPAQFMAAVMSNYGGFYTTQAYISETQRLGIKIMGPDVNDSKDKFFGRGGVDRVRHGEGSSVMQSSKYDADDRSGKDVTLRSHFDKLSVTTQCDRPIPRSCAGTVRVGLCRIKGLSQKARSAILVERDTHGEFVSLYNLLTRVDIEEAQAERLVLAGACDSLEPDCSRPRLFWKMRCFYQNQSVNAPAPRLRPFTQLQLWRYEYRTLGFLTAIHPIQLIRPRAPRGVVPLRDVPRYLKRIVSFYGWCVTSKTVSTHAGENMQFVTFEDETGLVETVCFPDTYRRFVHLLGWQEAFLITGRVMEEYGAITVEVTDIRAAGEARQGSKRPKLSPVSG